MSLEPVSFERLGTHCRHICVDVNVIDLGTVVLRHATWTAKTSGRLEEKRNDNK